MQKKKRNLQNNKLLDLAPKILIFLCAIIISFISSYKTPAHNTTDLSSRIENISTSLSNISTELSEIQSELEGRIDLVENLKKEAEIAENVISLSEEQVNAVQAKLKQEFNVSSKMSFLQSFLLSLGFYILGLISKPLTNFIRSKSRKDDKSKSITSPKTNYSDEQIKLALQFLEAIDRKKSSDILTSESQVSN